MFDYDMQKTAKIAASFQIPVKPQILSDMQILLNDDEPDMNRIAGLISNDVGLSSAILKFINSPFYGMNRKIANIKQAVMMLGLTAVSSLVSALLLKTSFKGQACISLERFWDDSLDVAHAMVFIGKRVEHTIPVDLLYTIGLFQNCGIPLLALKYGDYKEILIEADRSGVNSIQLEEATYQTNHAVLGYYVASSWHLPKEICELILRHHDLDFIATPLSDRAQLAFAIFKVAENLVEIMKRQNDSPDWFYVKDNALNVLGITLCDYVDLEDEFVDKFV